MLLFNNIKNQLPLSYLSRAVFFLGKGGGEATALEKYGSGSWGTTFWSNYFQDANIFESTAKLFLSGRLFILDLHAFHYTNIKTNSHINLNSNKTYIYTNKVTHTVSNIPTETLP